MEVEAAVEDAWEFWTNVDNWVFDAGIDTVVLNGPIAAGSLGKTKTRGGQIVNWKIVEVIEGHSALIESPMPGSVGRFSRRIDGQIPDGTLITQVITLDGEQAEAYLPMMGENFEQGIGDGMAKLAEQIERKP